MKKIKRERNVKSESEKATYKIFKFRRNDHKTESHEVYIRIKWSTFKRGVNDLERKKKRKNA